jgi:hypothetical protein
MSNNGFNNQAEDEAPRIDGRRFIAKVVFNNDPLQKQRIKVTIPGLMEGTTDQLPWIGAVVRSDFGMLPSALTVAVPVINSLVLVSFQDGDLQYGMYEGSIHSGYTSSLGVLASGYPNRRGWIDPAGNLCYVDISPGATEMVLQHFTGTKQVFSNSGDYSVASQRGIRETATTEIRFIAPMIYLN